MSSYYLKQKTSKITFLLIIPPSPPNNEYIYYSFTFAPVQPLFHSTHLFSVSHAFLFLLALSRVSLLMYTLYTAENDPVLSLVGWSLHLSFSPPPAAEWV